MTELPINQIICGDNMEVMAGLPDNCIDTIITDPPYGLGFMGKDWDTLDKSQFGSAGNEGENDLKVKKNFKILPRYNQTGIYEFYYGWAVEVLRIAKPGAIMLCFGGTRTYHRLVCALEDAGWQIRDCLMWLYGSGFPKSLDISKAIDKANRKLLVNLNELQDKLNVRRLAKGLTLKDINRLFGVAENSGCAAHKFCDKSQPQFPTREQMTILESVLELNGEFGEKLWELYEEIEREIIGKGKAGLTKGNICKFAGTEEFNITAPATDLAKLWNGWGTALKPAWEPIVVAMKPVEGTFAENAAKWGVAGLNIDGGRIEGNWNRSTTWKNDIRGGNFVGATKKEDLGHAQQCHSQGRWPANLIIDEAAGAMLDAQSGESTSTNKIGNPIKPSDSIGTFKTGIKNRTPAPCDSGGASRFFYCAKSSRSERNEGCEELSEQDNNTYGDFAGTNEHALKKDCLKQNNHPTVKPLSLMEYLCTLTKQPGGGIILDPFAGSGTTCVAAKRLGRPFIGIEKSPEYCLIAEKRVAAVDCVVPAKERKQGQKALF